MRRLRLAIALLSIFAIVLPARAESRDPSDRLYSIRLERPAHPGKAGGVDFSYAAVETQRTWYDDTKDPVVTRQSSLGVRLVAAMEFIAVGPDGHATLERLDVRSLTTLDDNGNTTDLLPSGSQVYARRSGKRTVFTLNSRYRPAPAAVAAALSHVINLKPKAVIDDDLIFGTTEPRRIGQAWEINRDAAAKAFRYNGIFVRPEDVTGGGRITGTETYDGDNCLHVIAEMNVKGMVELEPNADRNDPTTHPARPDQSESMTSKLEWLSPMTEAGGTDRMTTIAEKTFTTRDTEDGRPCRRERVVKEQWDSQGLPK